MWHWLAVTAGLAAFTAGATVPPDSIARPDARYRLSIAGIPIGSAALSVSVQGGRYTIDGTADFGFLFWGGRGGARAEGLTSPQGWTPLRYRLAYEGTRRPGGMEIDFENGRAVRFHSFPPPPADVMEGRITVQDDHLKAVLDPLTALVVPVPPDTDADAVCQRLLPVFSGFTRFDLELTGALDVETGIGCSARYLPVSGHRPDSRSVERMTQPGAFEIALAPLANYAWAPSRVAIQTRFGTFEMIREP